MCDKAFSANDLLNLKLLMATEMLIRLYKPILKKYDLVYNEYVVLIFLWRAKKLRKEDFKKELYMEEKRIDDIINSLKGKDIISEVEENVVEITRKGTELWDEIENEIDAYPLCSNLFKDEYGVYIDILSDIIQNLNDIQYRVIKTNDENRVSSQHNNYAGK